jgi:hypothetical protein
LSGSQAFAENLPDTTRLLRFPTTNGKAIVFCYAGELYSVPKEGGIARRLTSGPGYTSFPHFSPDGSQIAFTSQYDGNTEVYVMPAEGGAPKRLTTSATLGRARPRGAGSAGGTQDETLRSAAGPTVSEPQSRHCQLAFSLTSNSVVDPEKDGRQKYSERQTNRRDQRLSAESIGHDHSDDCGQNQTKRGRKHEVTQRSRFPSFRGWKMRLLVDA